MAIKFLTEIQTQGNNITGLPSTPSQSDAAASKAYVDSVAQGLDIKASVKAASTAPLATLSGNQTVGGVAVTANDRVLLKNQSTPSENGIYDVKAGAWTKATDADGANLTLGSFTFVESGDNAGKGFVYSSTNTWTQFSESTSLTAGTGISINGQTISINDQYTGQSTINTLGTVTTGTWSASTIGVDKGGTGATTFSAGFLKANGTNAFTTTSTIPVTDISGRKINGTFTAAQNSTTTEVISTTTLDSTLRTDAIVQLRDASNNVVFGDVTVNADNVTIVVKNNTGTGITLKYTILV